MNSVIWRTTSFFLWPVVTELGNEHIVLAIDYSLEVGVTSVLGFLWGKEDTSAFSLGPAPESKLQPQRKVFGQSPLSDRSLMPRPQKIFQPLFWSMLQQEKQACLHGLSHWCYTRLNQGHISP